jgi:hypothetical protein
LASCPNREERAVWQLQEIRGRRAPLMVMRIPLRFIDYGEIGFCASGAWMEIWWTAAVGA